MPCKKQNKSVLRGDAQGEPDYTGWKDDFQLETLSGDDFSNTTMKLNTTILMHKELQQNLSSTSKHVYTDL